MFVTLTCPSYGRVRDDGTRRRRTAAAAHPAHSLRDPRHRVPRRAGRSHVHSRYPIVFFDAMRISLRQALSDTGSLLQPKRGS
jgi:hypothetical protein